MCGVGGVGRRVKWGANHYIYGGGEERLSGVWVTGIEGIGWRGFCGGRMERGRGR